MSPCESSIVLLLTLVVCSKENDLGSYIMGCQINAPVFKQQECTDEAEAKARRDKPIGATPLALSSNIWQQDPGIVTHLQY